MIVGDLGQIANPSLISWQIFKRFFGFGVLFSEKAPEVVGGPDGVA
jgi:hypothetical protein